MKSCAHFKERKRGHNLVKQEHAQQSVYMIYKMSKFCHHQGSISNILHSKRKSVVMICCHIGHILDQSYSVWVATAVIPWGLTVPLAVLCCFAQK